MEQYYGAVLQHQGCLHLSEIVLLAGSILFAACWPKKNYNQRLLRRLIYLPPLFLINNFSSKANHL